MVIRVFNNSRGYVNNVEQTTTDAPATEETEKGIRGGSPGLGVKNFFTVSYAKC